MAIYIKESHKGLLHKNLGVKKGEKIPASKLVVHKSDSATLKKRKVFAQNAKKWKHAYGGAAYLNPTSSNIAFGFGGNVPIEVEGGEVAVEPDGYTVHEYNGPSHEQGGIDDSVPEGTDIYSDRIAIDGKTMAERKMDRLRNLKKIEKTKDRRPVDFITNNTINKVKSDNAIEEQNDMLIQQVVAHTMKQPQQKAAYGKKGVYAYGEEDVTNPLLERNNPVADTWGSNWASVPSYSPSVPIPETAPISVTGNIPDYTPKFGNDIIPSISAPFTAGNVAGIIGTGINTIAPLATTKKYFKNRVLPTNNAIGFNKDALDTNTKEQDILEGMKNTALVKVNQARNNNIMRNNGSTRSLNALRTLNTATDIASGDEVNNVTQSFAGQTMNVLNNRANLQTQRDSAIASGKNRVEDINRVATEDYYTALNKDLGNVGTGIQREGQIMNQQKQNQDFLDILPLLSKHGLAISYVNGKPTLVNS